METARHRITLSPSGGVYCFGLLQLTHCCRCSGFASRIVRDSSIAILHVVITYWFIYLPIIPLFSFSNKRIAFFPSRNSSWQPETTAASRLWHTMLSPLCGCSGFALKKLRDSSIAIRHVIITYWFVYLPIIPIYLITPASGSRSFRRALWKMGRNHGLTTGPPSFLSS